MPLPANAEPLSIAPTTKETLEHIQQLYHANDNTITSLAKLSEKHAVVEDTDPEINEVWGVPMQYEPKGLVKDEIDEDWPGAVV